MFWKVTQNKNANAFVLASGGKYKLIFNMVRYFYDNVLTLLLLLLLLPSLVRL